MGFGGSVAAMISSLKSNARSRKTTYDKKDKTFDRYGHEKKNRAIKTKSATPEQLEKVRTRLKKENRIQTRIAIAIVVVSVLVFLYMW